MPTAVLLLHNHLSPLYSLSVNPMQRIQMVFTTEENSPPSSQTRPHLQQKCHTLPDWHKYKRFTAGAGIISSSYDVFANAQRIVKVKEAKSEERTVKKTEHLIFI